MLVTARKLNDLDENQLGVETIEAPKQIESSPSALTAKELAEEK
jgi:DNA recombination protein RmuC